MDVCIEKRSHDSGVDKWELVTFVDHSMVQGVRV